MPRTRFLVLSLVVAACGGSSATSTQAARSTQASDADRPPSDRGLSTRPRTDPPPFPVDQLRSAIQPVGGTLPPERLAQLASFIRWYERDPFDPTIGVGLELSVRATLLAWIAESPDVSVVITPFLGQGVQGRGGDGDQMASITAMGSLFGMAAHAIEHPEYDSGSDERQAAGIESALRWYEAAVARGSARNGYLDELIQERNAGRLVQWFAEHITLTD